jgi:biotin carboxylase
MNYRSHYDIASFIYKDEFIINNFKYDENVSKWFKMDLKKKEWVEDMKAKKLGDEIKTRIVNKFIKLHQEISNNGNGEMDEIGEMRSIFFLETAFKLKQEKYVRLVIKELKQFY